MPKVDAKGRVVLPKRLRERLGIEPGTEVAVHEEGGKVVVEPEDDPEEILDRMEELVAETSSAGKGTVPLNDEDPVARKHREAVRRGSERNADG